MYGNSNNKKLVDYVYMQFKIHSGSEDKRNVIVRQIKWNKIQVLRNGSENMWILHGYVGGDQLQMCILVQLYSCTCISKLLIA